MKLYLIEYYCLNWKRNKLRKIKIEAKDKNEARFKFRLKFSDNYRIFDINEIERTR